MPRAHRYFLPGHVWHITQRCHNKCFLLKFSCDRARWIHWLFEAKKRYGLSVLNYIVTSNHIHLLVYDTKPGVISKSLQLIAGQVGQEYNRRKHRKGAFWEDQYHAVAIEQDHYLNQCLVYIDMNMVRAGVVKHPRDWLHSGYNEIQSPRERYQIIDQSRLLELYQLKEYKEFQQQHHDWIEEALQKHQSIKEARWTKSLAVGSESFIKSYQKAQGIKAKYRIIEQSNTGWVLKEAPEAYDAHFDFDMKKRVLSDNKGIKRTTY